MSKQKNSICMLLSHSRYEYMWRILLLKQILAGMFRVRNEGICLVVAGCSSVQNTIRAIVCECINLNVERTIMNIATTNMQKYDNVHLDDGNKAFFRVYVIVISCYQTVFCVLLQEKKIVLV